MPKEKSQWLKKFFQFFNGIADNTIDLWNPSIFSELKNNEVKSVVKQLNGNPLLEAIKALNFSKAKLEPKSIASLLEAFNSCQLEKLDVSHQNLLPGAVEVIISQLKNQTLQELRLRSCKLDEPKLLSILEAISQNQSLKELHITHQNLSAEMVKFIAKMLRINATIKSLVLEHCQLDEDKFSPVVDALLDNSSLRKLELSTNSFSYTVAKHLDSILAKHNPSIICKTVSKAVKEFDEILTALATLPAVKLSSLNSLRLDQEDEKTISRRVSLNKKLSAVSIKKSFLNNVAIIVRALPGSTKITIDLSDQEVDIELICELLKKAHIVSLDLANTKLGPKDAKKIAWSLKENKSLKSLYLSNNQLGDEGIEYLSQALSENNSTLLSLDLNDNNFTTVGLERIVAMLAFHYNLLDVNCRIDSTKTDPIKTNQINIKPIFKITVIGYVIVGKSNICTRFVANRFYDSAYDLLGVDDSYRKELSNCVIDLFDITGMEEYSALRTSFYPRTDLFLVCFSLVSQQSFDAVRGFIDEIERYCPGTPFLLIGTKSDLTNEIEVNDKDAQKRAQAFGAEEYIKCSARNGSNIDYIFQRASEICFKQDISRELWQRMQSLIRRNRELNKTSIELKKLKDENKKLKTLLNATKSSQTLISPSSKQATELATSLKTNATQSYDQLSKIVQQSPLRYGYNQEGKLISGSSTSTTKPLLRWQRNNEGKLITTSVSFWQPQVIESTQGTVFDLSTKIKQTSMIAEKENVSMSQSKH